MPSQNTRYPPSFAYRSAPSIGHHAEDSRQSVRSRISQRPPTLQRNLPLPSSSRLSPLINRDEPLPPIPFTRLDNNLQWGESRYLPCRRSQGRHGITPEELSNSATIPESGVFRLVINIRGREHEVRVYPNIGATAVLVADVVAAVESELESAANRWPGGLLYNGRAANRGSDGLWFWHGLAGATNVDEQGVWILYL
jgi:hypothetical protein